MSVSITSICNQALVLVDGETISVPSSDPSASREANICAMFKDSVREEVLAMHTWNFATLQAELEVSAEAPEFEFTYAYTLPSDCIRVTKIDGDYQVWKVKGQRSLHTCASPCKIEYIADVQDPNHFPPFFVKLYRLGLAKTFAFALGRGSSKEQELAAQFDKALAEAKQADAREGHADGWNVIPSLDSRASDNYGLAGPEWGYVGFPWYN